MTLLKGIRIESGSLGYIVLLFLFAVVLGCICGAILQSHRLNNILLCLGVSRTTNTNVWDDVILPNCWLMVYLKSDKLVYFGQYKYGEEFARKPLIVLENYKIMNLDGEVIEDNTGDNTNVALIDTESVERIEVTYK